MLASAGKLLLELTYDPTLWGSIMRRAIVAVLFSFALGFGLTHGTAAKTPPALETLRQQNEAGEPKRIAEQSETRLAAWPPLPAANAAVEIPAQDWPRRPGPRQVRVLVHYPGGKLASVTAATGILLSLHNWGGVDCAGTADPKALADKLNVVALCVNYLQSGKQDSIEGPEPYDFGYLQGLDALRAVWWLQTSLRAQQISFAEGRIFATGGSGGGNVALMANKLAPRTFACIVDLCGMKKLSADIAFHLPGGSDLDARWSRDPASPNYLSPDEQDLRFVGHAGHLERMKRLGTSSRIISVHGVDDVTCPFADARELVERMQAAKLVVEPHFIAKADLDGKVFTSSGHALGNRTQIVLQVAGEYLAPDGPRSVVRKGLSDFDCRDEQVRYQTPGGQFVISYAAGYPVGRFEADPPAVPYEEHQNLGYYRDRAGQRHDIRTADDWQIRRQHIQANLQRVLGTLPGESMRVPLDVRVVEETKNEKLVRRKISFQSDPFDRVTAWLLLPLAGNNAERRPAMLCLHQTTRAGKDETAGLSGSANKHYGRELAERGYVVLAPDYPSFGEHAYDFAQHPEFASGSLKAIWDNLRAVDLLACLPEVDPQRIGVIGHSLGGHNALFTAVFEPRLKVVVSSCGYSSLQKDDVPSWSGPCYIPRIASQFASDAKQVPFDFTEIIASLAPRACFTVAATRDNDFDVTGVRDVIAAAEPLYKLLGKPQHLQAIYPQTPHDFPQAAREQAYEFVDKHLLAQVAEQSRVDELDPDSILSGMRTLHQDRKWKQLIEQFGSVDFSAWPADQTSKASEALHLRGQIYSFVKDGPKAEADLKKGIKLAPSNAALWLTLAENYTNNLRDDEQALAAYRQAFAITGKGNGWQSLTATIAMARLLTDQVKTDEAFAVLKVYGDMEGVPPVWRIKLLRAYGHAYAAQGNEQESLASFREALQLEAPPATTPGPSR